MDWIDGSDGIRFLVVLVMVVAILVHAFVLHCILQRLRLLDDRIVRLIRGTGIFHEQVTMLLRRIIGDMLTPTQSDDSVDDTEVR
jgi:hypothetical protein